MTRTVSITCPHCGCNLSIDLEAGVVVDHQPLATAQDAERVDFDARLKQLETDKARAADRMAEALRKEKSRDRLMADKFRELMDRAAKDGDDSRPIRDIDLD
jgi:hypothetical protein